MEMDGANDAASAINEQASEDEEWPSGVGDGGEGGKAKPASRAGRRATVPALCWLSARKEMQARAICETETL